MKRNLFKFIAVTATAFVLALTAQNAQAGVSAYCGQMNGAHYVSCDSGVTIYRPPTRQTRVVTLPAKTTIVNGTSQQSQRNIAIASQLEFRRLALEEKRFEAEQRALRMQDRARSNRPYSRRYVSYNRSAYAGRPYNRRRHYKAPKH